MNGYRNGIWQLLIVLTLISLMAGCTLGEAAARPPATGQPEADASQSAPATQGTTAPVELTETAEPASSEEPADELTASSQAEADVQPTPLAQEATPRPTREGRTTAEPAVEGRLLYSRAGNLFEWSGASSRQLTTSGDLNMPRWSPDGERIAAIRQGDSFSNLVLLDRDGQDLETLTDHESSYTPGSKEYVTTSIWALNPVWNPAGSKLLYTADATATNLILWQIDAAGGDPQPLRVAMDLGANIEEAAYAPDGTHLAFTLSYDAPTQLWMADLTTGTRVQLTDGQHTTYDPAWSPDGHVLAVAIVEQGRSTIWLISPDGQERTQIIDQPVARSPVWSPDGTQMAFVGEEGGQFNVYVVDVNHDGNGSYDISAPRRLTTDGDVDAVGGLSWAP